MDISGRTWDLITGGEMKIKEVREGRATYYLVPFEFLIESTVFLNLISRLKGPIRPTATPQNTIVASGVTLREFVLASNNAGKLSEFSELFQNMCLTVAPQRDYGVTDADETGLSFIENALIKARHASEATGLPQLQTTRVSSSRP